MSEGGYPTEGELEKMRSWPREAGYRALMEYVASIWWPGGRQGFARRGNRYYLSTGGWSGNEEIIAALQENVAFWLMCWESTHRGGRYVFRIAQEE